MSYIGLTHGQFDSQFEVGNHFHVITEQTYFYDQKLKFKTCQKHTFFQLTLFVLLRALVANCLTLINFIPEINCQKSHIYTKTEC